MSKVQAFDHQAIKKLSTAITFVIVLILISHSNLSKPFFRGFINDANRSDLQAWSEIELSQRRIDTEIAFTRVEIDAFSIPESSYTCDDDRNARKICIFENVLQHAGWLLYVVKDEQQKNKTVIPDPRLSEIGIGNPDFGVYKVPKAIKVLTVAELKERLRSDALAMEPPTNYLEVKEFDNAILQRVRTFKHIFWVLNGVGNVYVRLCRYLQVCSPKDIQSTAILHPFLEPEYARTRIGYGNTIEAIHNLMECFGPVIRFNHPDAPFTDIDKADMRIFFFKRLLAGIGDSVAEPEAARDPDMKLHYTRYSNEWASKRTQYLRQCAGLSPEPRTLRRASVLLVNRPHDAGRHIIGLDDVFDRLQRQLKSLNIAVELYFPRVESLYAQASVFNSHNIFVVPHGAANTNFQFLPHRARIFALYAIEHRHLLDVDHVKALPSPPYDVSIDAVNCTESIEANVFKVQRIKSFQDANNATRSFVLSDTKMSKEKAAALQEELGITSKTWMEYVSYVVDAEDLARKVAAAARSLDVELRNNAAYEDGPVVY